MNVFYSPAFEKELSKLKDQALLGRIAKALENAERAKSLREIPQIKKLEGGSNYYRIRVGDYRLCFSVNDYDIIFKRCQHRSSVYNDLP